MPAAAARVENDQWRQRFTLIHMIAASVGVESDPPIVAFLAAGSYRQPIAAASRRGARYM